MTDHAIVPLATDPFPGDSEMAAMMRTVEWASTPIGSPDAWPQSLLTSLSICLSSRFPILLWWGPAFVMLYNDAYRHIIAAKHPAAMGSAGAECFPEIWDVIGPMLEGVRQGGTATWSEDQVLFLRRNGFTEECYFTFSYSPIRDETGGVGGVFCAVTETTPQILRERRLALLRDLAVDAGDADEAAARAMAVLERQPADLPFALLYRRTASGLRLAATAGIQARARVEPPPDALVRLTHPTVIEDLGPLLAEPPPDPWGDLPTRAVTMRLDRPGSDEDWGVLVLGLAPRLAFDAEYADFARLVAGALAAAMTNADAYEAERRRAEALAELDRAKTAFFTNISHEFRTPLTLLLGPLGELASEPSLGADVRGRVELAHRNARRLLRLVNALLEFSRIEAGRAQARFEPMDPGPLTSQLASMFRSAFEAAGIRLLVEVAPLPEPAYLDREMWERIVLNLVSNAFKHTYEGHVAVRIGWDEGLVLSVDDTGVGIPPAELPRVFERFHRVESPAARTHEGTGIGLALVQELVRLHGGRIEVVSEVGRGSTFTVRIPPGRAHLPLDLVTLPEGIGDARRSRGIGAVAETGDAAMSRAFVEEVLGWLPDRGSLGDEATNGLADAPRVLVVDDNADMLAYVTGILGRDYRVETAGDGLAALERIRAEAPALVVADVMMPRLDGFGLVRQLRSDPVARTTPVILLSARAGEEAAIEGLSAGADDYLVKPFQPETLRARVAAQIATARLREEATLELRMTLEQLREQETQLRHALAAKDEFLGMVSHELKTPLTTILGNARVLGGEAGRLDPATRAGVAADIADEAERLNAVIENLLVLAKVEAGRSLDREPVLLGRLVERVVATHARTEEPGRFEVRPCAPELLVEAHGEALEQVISNLLRNATKYSPRGAPIEVGCAPFGREAELWVADRGVGLDPGEIEAIFEPFFRSHRTATKAGIGIGLAVCRRLVEALGGRLWAEAREGGGALFRVRLPLVAEPEP